MDVSKNRKTLSVSLSLSLSFSVSLGSRISVHTTPTHAHTHPHNTIILVSGTDRTGQWTILCVLLVPIPTDLPNYSAGRQVRRFRETANFVRLNTTTTAVLLLLILLLYTRYATPPPAPRKTACGRYVPAYIS